jgi:hypothetical protein
MLGTLQVLPVKTPTATRESNGRHYTPIKAAVIRGIIDAVEIGVRDPEELADLIESEVIRELADRFNVGNLCPSILLRDYAAELFRYVIGRQHAESVREVVEG